MVHEDCPGIRLGLLTTFSKLPTWVPSKGNASYRKCFAKPRFDHKLSRCCAAQVGGGRKHESER